MATLYVTEFNGIAVVPTSGLIPTVTTMQVPHCPKVATNNVTIGGTSTQSTAFTNQPGPQNQQTNLIRVHADSICSVEIGGANPTATTASMRFVAGQTEYFGVAPGDKLAVIVNV